MLHFIYFFQQL